MNINEQPSYFAVIPASVRYDKDLKANEKLLYGEITTLCNSNGICFVSNKYFADLYCVTSQAVSKWILHLQELGYITVEYTYRDNTKEIEKRIIRLKEVSTNIDTYQQMIEENNIKEKDIYYNNINYIDKKKEKEIINNKEKEIEIEFESLWQKYPKKVGKAKSLKSYIKARQKGATYDEVILGLENYLKQIEIFETKKQFIKDGSTWFNNECWKDEYQTTIQKGKIEKKSNFAGYSLDQVNKILEKE